MRIAGVCLLVAAFAASASAAKSPVLVTYEQTGGFIGIERSLAVHRSGRIVSDGFAAKTRQLAPARLRALREALVAARFATLSRRYESEVQIDDGYVYRIAYAGRAVLIDENAVLPPRLRRVFALLSGLVES